LARPTTQPRRKAAKVGARPAAPTMADITQSAGNCAASTTAAEPAAVRMPVPAKSSRN